MIKVRRSKAPVILSSRAVRDARRRARAYFTKPADTRAQSRFQFLVTAKIPGLLEALAQEFKGKCAYCETPIDPGDTYCSDHYRPRTGALSLDGRFDRDHYWWLAYEWGNYYYVCSDCNRAKGNRFPIRARRRATAPAKGAELRKERPLILDPAWDDPEDHLVFTEDGKVASATEEGLCTIDILAFNRMNLVEARRALAQELRQAWSAITDHSGLVAFSREMTEDDLPYLGLRRQLLRQWLTGAKEAKTLDLDLSDAPQFVKTHTAHSVGQVNQVVKSFNIKEAAQEAYDVEDPTTQRDYFIKSRLVTRIEVTNFRIIDSLKLDIRRVRQQRAPWVMLLGENGVGKSTLLQAVAIALIGEKERRRLKLDARTFIRHNCESGEVRVYLSGVDQPIVMTFNRKSKFFKAVPRETKVLVLAYGATRLLPKVRMPATAKTRFSRTENLFSPFAPLVDASAFLCGLGPTAFDAAARVVKDLLVLAPRENLIKARKPTGAVEIRSGRQYASLTELSDGYQSVVGVVADIMSVLSQRWTAMEVAEGIVLIDELGAHLHPRWKMEIVGRLRRCFPRVQFLVTTHDPLCLRGLVAGEIVVMQRDAKHRIDALRDLPSPEGMRVDQLLTSEHFGLNSTIDPDLDATFKRLYDLLGKTERSAKEEAQVARLKADLAKRGVMGQTPRERIVLEAADEYIAKQRTTAASAGRAALSDAARERIVNVWEQLAPDGRPAPLRSL